MTSNNDRASKSEWTGCGRALTEEMDALIHRALSVCGALKADVARQGASEALKNCARQLYDLAEQIASLTEEAKKQLEEVPNARNEERQLLEASWKFHFSVVRRIIEDINWQILINISNEMQPNGPIN